MFVNFILYSKARSINRQQIFLESLPNPPYVTDTTQTVVLADTTEIFSYVHTILAKSTVNGTQVPTSALIHEGLLHRING